MEVHAPAAPTPRK